MGGSLHSTPDLLKSVESQPHAPAATHCIMPYAEIDCALLNHESEQNFHPLCCSGWYFATQ